MLLLLLELFSMYQPPKCTGDEIRNRYYIQLRNAQKNNLSPPWKSNP